ncbi:hypothetical protein [Actinophytocola gossypii]|uniref:DUF998 domain-containing protein n=1 Tax=Actinophytocola gossypii TaxID=2812003 RepID=A0ABT2J7V1_9PSEU|nr:hypothetical protein [Actinophytocola gossypii]MCT2583927.1 hypothetical protein [Actinophytocola gossypii]
MRDRAPVGGRHEYWLPLALLGLGLLGLLGWEYMRPGSPFGWFAYAPLSADQSVSGHLGSVTFYDHSFPARDWPWVLVITAVLVATVARYGVLARRAGGSARTHVTLAVCGGVGLPLGYVVAGMAGTTDDPAGLITSVALPVLGLAAVAAAWAGLRLGPGRRSATLIGAVSLVVGAGVLLGALAGPGLLEPVVVAGGLLALARHERSLPLAILAGAVLVPMVLFPIGAQGLLIPAVLVSAAAVVALVRRRRLAEPA